MLTLFSLTTVAVIGSLLTSLVSWETHLAWIWEDPYRKGMGILMLRINFPIKAGGNPFIAQRRWTIHRHSAESEGWDWVMKNTGKRIFAVLVFSLISAVPFMAMAGVHFSQR